MALAEREDNHIILSAEYRENELCKQVPGLSWSTAEQRWKVPLSWAACVQLRGIFGADLQIGRELAAWSRAERAGRIDPCMELRSAEDAPELADRFPDLRPYQRAGARFLATARQALIADEMGTGKTVQTITALEIMGDEAFPCLVVCPNSMKFKWAEEFTRWAPERRAIVVHGGKQTRIKQLAAVQSGEYDIAIMNWESLKLHTRLAGYGSAVALTDKDKEEKELNFIDWKTIVADEAHRAKNPRAQQTRALWWLGDRSTNRLALTGTPVANSPEDIWTLMRFVSPQEFPAKTRFIDRYALLSWNFFGGMEVIGIKTEVKDELFRILDPRFIRRLKAAILPQLPPKTYTTRTVELAPKQRKSYDAIRKEMLAELEGGVLLATNPLAKLTRMLQFASAHGEMQGDKLVLTEPSCKIDALEEIVQELGDQRALVFAESRQLLDLAEARLRKMGIGVGKITGEVPAYERQEYVNQFNDNRLKIMLLSLGAGGEGLSFPGCTVEIFLQRSFNEVKNSQAEDRAHGIGRGSEHEATEIIDVIASDTIESRVHEVRQEKREMLEEIVRDADNLRLWLEK